MTEKTMPRRGIKEMEGKSWDSLTWFWEEFARNWKVTDWREGETGSHEPQAEWRTEYVCGGYVLRNAFVLVKFII